MLMVVREGFTNKISSETQKGRLKPYIHLTSESETTNRILILIEAVLQKFLSHRKRNIVISLRPAQRC
jgi:hypothetical protein